MKDEGCPTCGSKNFGNIEMKKNVRRVTGNLEKAVLQM